MMKATLHQALLMMFWAGDLMSISVEKSLERIKMASDMSFQITRQPLVLAYSGGKDSDTVLHLMLLSGVPFEVVHSLTTVDPPDVVRHVYDVFLRLEMLGVPCTVDKHVNPDGSRTTMWNLIPRKLMPPTRIVRYCCSELKENAAHNRMTVTGVRWAESVRRSKTRGLLEVQKSKVESSLILLNDNDDSRKLFDNCHMKGRRVFNPIVDWTDDDVFSFLADERIEICDLYSRGFKRCGCVGCPMAGKHGREREFYLYPEFRKAYIRAFDNMLKVRSDRGKTPVLWSSGVDVFDWWMEYENLPGQFNLFDV